MARALSRLGRRFKRFFRRRRRIVTLKDFIERLENSGRVEEASSYRKEFVSRFYPLLSEKQVLNLPFGDVCKAVSLLNRLNEKSVEQPRMFDQNSLFLISDTPGEWWLRERWLNKTGGKSPK